jgi:hypothetical protein
MQVTNKQNMKEDHIYKEILLELKKCYRNSLGYLISGILISSFITINLWFDCFGSLT